MVLRANGPIEYLSAASTEMPFFLVGTHNGRTRGRRHRLHKSDPTQWRAIGFPQTLKAVERSGGRERRLALDGISHLVLMTDGFQQLERMDGREKVTLSTPILCRLVGDACSAETAELGPKKVADKLVESTRAWRGGRILDPDEDDDRLVLVLDVKRALDHFDFAGARIRGRHRN